MKWIASQKVRYKETSIRTCRICFYFIVYAYFCLSFFFKLSKLRSGLGEAGGELLKSIKWKDWKIWRENRRNIFSLWDKKKKPKCYMIWHLVSSCAAATTPLSINNLQTLIYDLANMFFLPLIWAWSEVWEQWEHCYGLNSTIPKFISWCHNPKSFRRCPSLEIGSW